VNVFDVEIASDTNPEFHTFATLDQAKQAARHYGLREGRMSIVERSAISHHVVAIHEYDQSELEQRKWATLLAALRYWQRIGLASGGQLAEHDIATDGGTLEPLSVEEIDILCGELQDKKDLGKE
jgi:hypothetical protein